VFALWGLWDAHVGLGEAACGHLFATSVACLRRRLDEYDTGWWTRYSLYPHLLPDLAKPFYHRLHYEQMEVLYRLTGFREFRDAARRWRRYDGGVARSAAVMHKAMFRLARAAER
jgi:hypothetical protein